MRNELIQDGSRSKIVRLIVEGEGLLSLFDFPSIAGSDYLADAVGSSATASLQGRKLLSKRTSDFEITPTDNTTNIALRTIRVWESDPSSGHLSTLTLPPIRLSFSPLSSSPKKPPAVPDTLDRLPLLLWMLLLVIRPFVGVGSFSSTAKGRTTEAQFFTPPEKAGATNFKELRFAAISADCESLARSPNSAASLLVTLSQHLSPEEWKSTERTFRNLEWIAFSPVKTASLTYQEMKEACSSRGKRMGPMKAPKNVFSLRNLILMIPLFLFLVLSFLSWKRGQEGISHQRLVEILAEKSMDRNHGHERKSFESRQNRFRNALLCDAGIGPKSRFRIGSKIRRRINQSKSLES